MPGLEIVVHTSVSGTPHRLRLDHIRAIQSVPDGQRARSLVAVRGGRMWVREAPEAIRASIKDVTNQFVAAVAAL